MARKKWPKPGQSDWKRTANWTLRLRNLLPTKALTYKHVVEAIRTDQNQEPLERQIKPKIYFTSLNIPLLAALPITSYPGPDRISKLAPELFLHIATHLPLPSLLALRGTSTHFRNTVTIPQVLHLPEYDINSAKLFLQALEYAPRYLHGEKGFACYTCWRIRPRFAFDLAALTGACARGQEGGLARFCVDCGLEGGLYRHGQRIRIEWPWEVVEGEEDEEDEIGEGKWWGHRVCGPCKGGYCGGHYSRYAARGFGERDMRPVVVRRGREGVGEQNEEDGDIGLENDGEGEEYGFKKTSEDDDSNNDHCTRSHPDAPFPCEVLELAHRKRMLLVRLENVGENID